MGNIFGPSIGDLTAMQRMIDHVNHTIEHDFATVQELAGAVKITRAKLDEEMTSARAALAPSCQQYADARQAIFDGKDGQQDLVQACLEAQGAMKTFLSLDMKVTGCTDACIYTKNYEEWVHRDDNLWCDHGACQSILRCTRNLEALLSQHDTKIRDEEVMNACSTQGFDLLVAPPSGMSNGGGAPKSIEEQSMCQKETTPPPAGAAPAAAAPAAPAAPAKSSMSEVVVALAFITRECNRRKHGGRAGLDFL